MHHEGMISGHTGVIVLVNHIILLVDPVVEACCWVLWSAGTCPGKGEAGERKERAA